MKSGKIALFLTALCQVTFVAMNVVFISRGLIALMVVTGFMISFIWTLNVKKVAFGGWADRFTYAFGAAAGTYLGYIISHQIIKFL